MLELDVESSCKDYVKQVPWEDGEVLAIHYFVSPLELHNIVMISCRDIGNYSISVYLMSIPYVFIYDKFFQ